VLINHHYIDSGDKIHFSQKTVEELGKMVQSVDFTKMRAVIEHIPNKRDRVLIKTLYLTAARVSEIVTKVGAYDLEHGKSKAYGKYLTFKIEHFPVNRRKTEPVLVITEATAKRKLKTKEQQEQGYIPKVIALPCNPVYEPFTQELLKWIQAQGTLSFPITRSWVYKIVQRHLRRLDPKVRTHSLRHWRITHLAEKYQFDPYDLSAYAGWSLQHGFAATGGVPVSPKIDVYMHSAWQKYLSKLLKPIQDIR
jgi:integrase